MTYKVNTTQPALVTQQIDNINVPKVWVMSGTDADSTVYGANYISDGQTLGMAKGDIVDYIYTTTPELYRHIVISIQSGGTGVTLGSSPSTSS